MLKYLALKDIINYYKVIKNKYLLNNIVKKIQINFRKKQFIDLIGNRKGYMMYNHIYSDKKIQFIDYKRKEICEGYTFYFGQLKAISL